MSAPAPKPSRARGALLAFVVAAASFLLYLPTRSFEFLNYDDDVYVSANPMLEAPLDAAGWRALLTTSRAANWHPLTWLSHHLDVQLFGLDPGAHHLVNAGFHALNAALLVLLLAALGARLLPVGLAVLLFALHPLRAESVAWISERKDLLAAFFFLLTSLAHVARVRAQGRGTSKAERAARGGLVAVLLALGLAAKPMLVTVPLVLLLLDRWPLARRRSLASLLLEKLPLFLLVGVSVLLTLRAQARGGAMDALVGAGFGERLANAAIAVERYLETTVWPHDLALFYPHPACFPGAAALLFGPRLWLGLGLLLALSAGAFALRRRAPELGVGWAWFLVTLLPVLGIVQVGLQSHADRYTLIPSMGLALALAFSLTRLADTRPETARAVLLAGGVLLAPLTLAAHRQIATWRDSATAMGHAVAVTDRNFLAETNLARALEDAGRGEEALEHYRLAARYKPGVPLVHYQLGRALSLRGDLAGATEQFRLAISGPPPRAGVLPEYGAARTALGINLSRLGQDAEALGLLETSWDAQPRMSPEKLAAGQALAWVLATSGDAALRDGARALEVVEELLHYQRSAGLLETLAAARAEVGDFPGAVAAEREALEQIPPAGRPGARDRLARYQRREPYRRTLARGGGDG